jgi:hypothetical protein
MVFRNFVPKIGPKCLKAVFYFEIYGLTIKTVSTMSYFIDTKKYRTL